MKTNTVFKVLFLLARPAAGKSEIIQFLQTLPEEKRKAEFHIGKMHVIDDFPMIWTWFEEDDLLTEMGRPHLHTDKDGYFLEQYFWNLLIRRMNLEYMKFIRDHQDDQEDFTVFIEFSRGKEHGGYLEAFRQVSTTLAQQAAILYVNVSWEESLRKNRKRFDPEKPDGILEHSLPDEKLARMYKETDWNEIINKETDHIEIASIKVPYSILENEDDITSGDLDELSTRLKTALNSLWKSYQLSEKSI
jgi:hypothetical protein